MVEINGMDKEDRAGTGFQMRVSGINLYEIGTRARASLVFPFRVVVDHNVTHAERPTIKAFAQYLLE